VRLLKLVLRKHGENQLAQDEENYHAFSPLMLMR